MDIETKIKLLATIKKLEHFIEDNNLEDTYCAYCDETSSENCEENCSLRDRYKATLSGITFLKYLSDLAID